MGCSGKGLSLGLPVASVIFHPAFLFLGSSLCYSIFKKKIKLLHSERAEISLKPESGGGLVKVF